MTAPSDQCAFSGWMEISGPQSGWGKPKISLTSWAWAVWDSLHPWPPRVSESTSVCRNSVLCAGHGRQNRTPGASRAGVQLPAGTSPPMGAPQSAGPGKREGGAPALSLSFSTRLPLSLPLPPSQSAGPGDVSRSRSERCLGQQNRDCTGQARSGGRGLDRQGPGAPGSSQNTSSCPTVPCANLLSDLA